jgi:hypothetical protein
MGTQDASGHSTTGTPGHACDFVAGWHTSTPVPTTRKVAWTSERVSPQTRNTLSFHSQNKQKGQNKSFHLSFVGFCSSIDRPFFFSEPRCTGSGASD